MSFIIDHTPYWVKKTYIAPLILEKIREFQYTRRYYNDQPKGINPPRQQVIYMADGRFTHGGLCDRLWGMISTYLISKKYNLDFRAHWVHPFILTNFLIPSNHDWRISDDEISYNRNESTPVFVNNNNNEANQIKLLNRVAGKKKHKQLHVYTPAHTDRDNFGKNFAEVFKPTPLLQSAIDEQLKAIGGEYVSISFRFQNLFGDFHDTNNRTLSAEEQKQMLEASLSTIKRVHDDNPDTAKVLVTADSFTILEAASKFPWVYIIPGKPIHIDFSESGENDMNHLKTFLDFFMIGHARRVYFAEAPGIYGSTFSLTASKLHKAEFKKIQIRTY